MQETPTPSARMRTAGEVRREVLRNKEENMDKRKKKTGKALWKGSAMAAAVCFLALAVLAFQKSWEKEAGGAAPTPVPNRQDTGFVPAGPGSFDSADTAIVMSRDGEKGTVTFLNLELGRRYTLSMDGTTRLYDKYGQGISVDQVHKGDIVDITFLKSDKHLTSLQMSSQTWVYDNVERYEIDAVRGEVSIGAETYKLTSNTQYLSEGRNVELMDLNAADVLNFQGIGNQVLAVSVAKGHGYLRLVNDEKFVGGWIEIGQTQIRRITEEMLLLVPEGSYEVNITNKGGGGVKNVVIYRNEETALDIGDLEVPEPQTGIVLFSVNPSSAELYIDGEKVDASAPMTLEYGMHQLIARADGYQSVSRYIRVAQESAGIDVTLDAVGAGDAAGTVSGNSNAGTTTNYYRVYIDAPEGAEVYLDGNYVGTAPCSFPKSEGSHIIILRKQGYETKSYTLQIDNSEKDLSYSFADLTENTLTNP